MSTNPVIAGNQNPLAPDTLGLPALNIPGVQLPTTADVIQNIPQSGVAKPGHFAQLVVDGPSVFNGAVYFGASQHAAWFDCSPATVDPTVVLDFAGGPQQYLFLTRDTTVWLPTTDQHEGMFFVMVQQDAVGGWDLTWKINNPTTDGSAVVIWLTGEEPVMSAAADSVRLYTFAWCQNLNGGLGAYVGSSTTDLATLGPPSSTDNAIVRFNGNTGTLVQNSSVTIDDSGNVFIGVTGLSDKLDVAGDIGLSGMIYPRYGSVGDWFCLQYVSVDGAEAIANALGAGRAFTIGKYVSNVYTPNVSLSGGAAGAVSYINVGNVGIGTSAPSEKLEVKGNVVLRSAGVDGGENLGNLDWGNIGNAAINARICAIRGDGAYGHAHLVFSTAPADAGVIERMRITLGGKVGVGTMNPIAKLSVYDTAGASFTGLSIINAPSGTNIASSDIVFGRSESHPLATIRGSQEADGSFGFGFLSFLTRASDQVPAERMRISGSGLVGISGDLYVGGSMSALSITDRTPVYEGDAVAELIKIKGVAGKIDHSTLPSFARHTTKLQVASETEKDEDGKAVMVETQEEGRDLGAMISMLTVAIKQLNDRLLAVEKR